MGGTEGCWAKEGLCQLSLSVFGWRTHNVTIIYAHRLNTSRKIAVFLQRLIDNGTLLLPGMFIYLKQQIQLIAIPGSGTEISSSREIRPRSQVGDKRKHRKESEQDLSSCGLPAVTPYKEKNPSRLGTD